MMLFLSRFPILARKARLGNPREIERSTADRCNAFNRLDDVYFRPSLADAINKLQERQDTE
jgi:hypothetical protein